MIAGCATGEGVGLELLQRGQRNDSARRIYVTGSGSSFGIEQVTLYVTTSYANNVVRFEPHTDGAFLRNSRIRYNSHTALEPVTGSGSRRRNTAWSTQQGTVVMMAGRNLHIVGNPMIYTVTIHTHTYL